MQNVKMVDVKMANGVISVKQVKVSNNKAVCLTVQQNNDLCCEV